MLILTKLKLAAGDLAMGTLSCAGTVLAIQAPAPASRSRGEECPCRPDAGASAGLGRRAAGGRRRSAHGEGGRSPGKRSLDTEDRSGRRRCEFRFRGTVARPDGQPAERAKVRLIYLRKPSSDNPPASALTDEQGKFAFSIKRSLLSDALIGPSSNSGLILIAEKDGFGFASEPAANFETSGRLEAGPDQQRRRGPRAEGEKADVLKLVLDDVPVRGRLVNSEGRPIAGAKIEVVSVVTQDRPLDAWEATHEKRSHQNGTAQARDVAIRPSAV